MKSFMKRTLLAMLRFCLGIKIVDQRTGKILGKVLVVRWKGGLRIIGLEEACVVPHFLPQKRETYWAQDLGFSTWAPPDFPSLYQDTSAEATKSQVQDNNNPIMHE